MLLVRKVKLERNLEKKSERNRPLKKYLVVIVLIIIFLVCMGISYFLSHDQQRNDVDEPVLGIQKLKQISGFTVEGNWSSHVININFTHIVKINFTLEWRDIIFGVNLSGNDKVDLFDMLINCPENVNFPYQKSILLNAKNHTGYIFIEFLNTSSPLKFDFYKNNDYFKNFQTCAIGENYWEVNVTCLTAFGFEPSCSCPSAVPMKDIGNFWILSIKIYTLS